MDKLIYLVPVMGLIGLFYTFIKFNWVARQDPGTERMKEISTYIADGAMAFLKSEWKILGYFVVIVGILLAVMASANPHSHWSIAIAFVIGAVLSATAGYIGMRVATKANVRTAQAARSSLSKALNVSFTGGSVMGLGVAGLAVLGLGGLFIVLKMLFAPDAPVNSDEMIRTIEVLTGFSLGAESIALFARVGGGIYTKAADVGADLVGKWKPASRKMIPAIPQPSRIMWEIMLEMWREWVLIFSVPMWQRYLRPSCWASKLK